MSKCQITEDSSPYYIRYTFNGLEKIIDLCRSYSSQEKDKIFERIALPEELTKQIVSLIPYSDRITFDTSKGAIYLSEPGLYYGAHKDGLGCKVSYNFAILIQDDKCVTSWYNEDEFTEYEILYDYIPAIGLKLPKAWSREIDNFDKSKHTPLKTMTLNPNEAILVNTDIWHDWDNSQSTNRRLVLTLKPVDPGKLSLEEAKKIIFNH